MSIKQSLAQQSDLRVSKLGYRFDIYSTKWTISKNRDIPFSSDVLSLDAATLDSFRQTLARYAEEMSDNHTCNMYFHFQRFIRDMKTDEVDIYALKNWRAMLGEEHEWYLGALKGFLISWHEWGYSGVSEDVVDYLEELRLSGNVKGDAVVNRCPFTGAFTDNEMLALDEELIRLFKNDKINLATFTYVMLLKSTARRPIQLSHLKQCDIQKITEEGVTNYKLHIPRAKQRGIGFRGALKLVTITEELYLILLNLAQKNQEQMESVLKIKLTADQIALVPIFVDWVLLDQFQQNGQFSLALLETDALHSSTTDLGGLLNSFVRQQFALSERTGDVIRISANRFKRTRGTNLGKKGLSAHIIAEALDHSDTQNVTVYSENTAETVQYIDEIMGAALAPLAAAFKGEIIEELSDGERGEDPTARIPNAVNETVGACGTNDFCTLGYEACYVCDKFRPLLYAPHDKFLDDLYKEKEFRLKKTGSVQFASTKDRLILAVENVVALCNQTKQERAEQGQHDE